MRTIAVISKPQKPELSTILPELVVWLQAHGYEPLLDPISASYIAASEAVPRHDMQDHAPELVIVLGGDGTLLAAARAFARTEIPILSINLGSLGFLTEVPLTHLYATLEAWCTNCCTIDERAMLHAEIRREGLVHHSFEALNDVVIAKGTIARMGDFVVRLDDSAVASFRADGVILSTPTGSTAYNLAANGPILAPDVDGMVLTAVCPHLLTIRPLVVRGDAHVTIAIEGVPEQLYLTVDGQEAVQMHLGDELHCWRSEHKIRLVRMNNNHSFFDVLRAKLKWGER
ncbi:MAG TPA: NAD(+)/NADH kinase [Acidobacteriaceae bacterium]|jgi:NAD+ kinase|nr:NAD(+)/NADH kinase [Acidobacteriaceae bacterium]